MVEIEQLRARLFDVEHSVTNLQLHADRQGLLLNLARRMIKMGVEEAAMVRTVFEIAGPHLNADIGAVYRVNKQANTMQLVESFGIPPELRQATQTLRIGEGYSGTVAACRSAITADAKRIATDEAAFLVKSMGVRALSSHPLFAQDGRVLGAFSVASTNRDSFTPDEVTFLHTLSVFLALAWERARTDQALHLSEARFRTGLLNTPIFLFTQDLELRYTWIHNPPFARSPDEFLGRRDPEILECPEDAQAIEAIKLEALETGRRQRHEVVISTEGEDHYFDLIVEPLHDAKNAVLGLTGIATDVTERKHRELSLRKEKDAAEGANRAKDNFLAALSHELRVPLTPVLMLAGAMERDASLTDELRMDFASIRRNILLEAQLIEDLLDLTRIARGMISLDLRETDVHEIAQNSVELLRSTAEAKKLAVCLELNATTHHVLADQVRLRQVFWNLFSNAIKFTPEGGEITIRTGTTAESRIRVEISDSGIGMRPEEMSRAFDAFSQGDHALSAERPYGGLGLGLSLSRQFVEMHHGDIRVESDGPGTGTTFVVELPLRK